MEKDNFNPIDVSVYEGAQIISNTDRVLINSKEDYLNFSNKGHLFSTNGSFHINTGEKLTNRFVVNAPQIQLGLDEGPSTEKNPAVKGNELEAILIELLSILEFTYKVDLKLLTPMTTLPGTPTAPDAAFAGKTAATRQRITNLKNRLQEFQSKKVFVT
jgi:hypothetical protein